VIDFSASKEAKFTWTEADKKVFKDRHTSDYGVGGYLYQLIDGTKKLVALVSKALTIVQLK
jgi:hypothetical protein